MKAAPPRLNETARAFLEERRFAVLATVDRDGSPQLSVMWYELRDAVVVMNTARGRVKERNLRRDPRASLLVEDEYRWVRVEGRVTLVEDHDVAQDDIRRLAIRYHGDARGEALARDTFSKQDRITLRMSIDRVTPSGFSS